MILMIKLRMPSPHLNLLLSTTLVAITPLVVFLLIHFPLLFGCCFPWFILNWLGFIYFNLSVFFFFEAEFACVSSPPHFLFCSPVTLINFWPVDSAWVLLLRGAAATNTFACWFLNFCFVLFICFVLKTYQFPLFHFDFFLPLVKLWECHRPQIRRIRLRFSGPHLVQLERAEILALSSKEHQRHYWAVSCVPGRHVYIFNYKQGRVFWLHNTIL